MNKLIIANWKMNKLLADATEYLKNIPDQKLVDIAIIPSFLLIREMKNQVQGRNILIGAQNMSEYNHGSYTGEVSLSMLFDAGCDLVLIGHSERRNLFFEDNDRIVRKVERAIVEKIPLILCVGETIEQLECGETEQVVTEMINSALSSIIGSQWDLVNIAYEPVWAIGTGKSPSPQQIQNVHKIIRGCLRKLCAESADHVRILYGGSVNLENVKDIFTLDNVNGVLVGGASLDPLSFNQLINEVVT